MCLILSTSHYKYRYYKITRYRLENRGFNENYFKYEMSEPCMRLIINDLLREYGYGKQYRVLKDKYAKSDIRIEDLKNRLIKSAMQKNRN